MKNTDLIFPLVLLLTACQQQSSFQPELTEQADTGRWYSQQQVESGKKLFAANCAICHGANAQATPNWKTTDSNGNFPPPPLNGSAHAWHHPLATLGEVIEGGGQPMGGIMPPFGEKLTEEQILAVIAGFQSHWDQSTYQKWLSIEQQSRKK
ncbi:cytochrome c [Gynuella sunshinyii]|uniref:Cytochrome c, mono-and diheme variant n=1 Tax=Gynuella sunshinyii YC6258 TaxID=1445510 RepID=A0A0C5UYH1_9GAMM|nr:cytochrome c [Gynuella sunshinyii]AJQ92330.1 cytochrome c, mono- and diheme variant [Gynuella sunshinyii YC6258]